MQRNLEVIRRCLKSTQASVRTRAQKILDIFKEVGDEESSEVPPVEEAPPLIDGVVQESAQSQNQPPSVLDLLGDASSPRHNKK